MEPNLSKIETVKKKRFVAYTIVITSLITGVVTYAAVKNTDDNSNTPQSISKEQKNTASTVEVKEQDNNLSTNPQANKEQTNTAPSKNIRTYTNSKEKYSFEYPSTWEVLEGTYPETSQKFVSLTSPQRRERLADLKKKNEIYEFADADVFFKSYPTKAKSVEELFKQDPGFEKIGTIKVGGVEATEVLVSGSIGSYAVFIFKEGLVYKIQITDVQSKSEVSPEKLQILSSFKFLK